MVVQFLLFSRVGFLLILFSFFRFIRTQCYLYAETVLVHFKKLSQTKLLTIRWSDSNLSHDFLPQLKFWVGYFDVSFTIFGHLGSSLNILIEVK